MSQQCITIKVFLEKLGFGKPARKRFISVVVLSLATVVSAWGRAVPDTSDALGFFSTVADKMLRYTFPFGVTNIPVCAKGVYVYTPAVQRLLQLAANIYDAANTNALPVVFRPLFANDASNDVFIMGYQQVTNVSGAGDPQLSSPVEVTQLMNYSGPQPIANASGPVNVYGVPWIIGVKKGLPGFNQFYLTNTVQVTRKLEVTRSSTNWATATYSTNQMYVMSMNNGLGVSFWNSYASDYVNRSGSGLTVYASDVVQMTLTNGANTWQRQTNFVYQSPPNFLAWAGSRWNTNIVGSTPAPSSFLKLDWAFNFLDPSIYRFNSDTFEPLTAGSTWETPPTLAPLPQFGLAVTNYLQAYILDGSNVIDYVQLRGPITSGNLNQALADPDYPDVGSAYLQWSTNAVPVIPAGVMNQLYVSGHDKKAPAAGGQWSQAPTSAGITTPPYEAGFFYGFFVPVWNVSGDPKTYYNTQLEIQAPYTPTRTVYTSFLLQANDPLVHSLASDLNSQNGAWVIWSQSFKRQNGFWYKSDDAVNQPLPQPPSNPIGGRYQPWLQTGQMASTPNVISVVNNYSVKDPLVKYSDNWNFPTNLLPSLTGLGQVHRGTPWQTFYLKDANLINYPDVVNGVTNYDGTNTWMQWTGDLDANDAVLMAPASDWRLAGWLMSLLNTNNPAQLLSVNDPNIANWQNVLAGLLAYSNSLPAVFFNSPLTFDTYVLAGNSPQTTVIASAITQARASQMFYSIGDILAVPALTFNSPFLNLGGSSFGRQQTNYGISDNAYEAIPAQLLPRLRPDSIGSLTPASNGWAVKFSGADGYVCAVQASTNLVDWNPVSTNAPGPGGFTVPVSPGAGSPNQFFRAVLLP